MERGVGKINNKNNPIRQHHVPQVYLKNFCSIDNSIAVWDKKDQKVFSTGVNTVGVERDFYTLNKLDDPYCWEHTYANGIEPLMGKIIPRVLSRMNLLLQNGTVIMSTEDKFQLALIMVMQILRGKQCREFQRRIFQNELPGIIKKLEERLGSFTVQEKELILGYYEDEFYFKRSAMDASLSYERITRFTNILCTRSFICFYLCGVSEFITSDNPVMFFNEVNSDSTPFMHGLFQLETGVCYPLSPKLLLWAVHPASHYSAIVKSDRCVIMLNSDQEKELVDLMNRMQIKQCFRQAYAKSEQTLRKSVLG